MASFTHNSPQPVTELAFREACTLSDNDDVFFADALSLSSSSSQTDFTNENNTGGLGVLGQWPYEDDDDYDQDMVDAISTDVPLLEELFNNALYLENFDVPYYHELEDEYHSGFLAPLYTVDTSDPNLSPMSSEKSFSSRTIDDSIGLPLEERYKITLKKLEASMKRSQETRKCLTMKTSVTTESYERVKSVQEILSSINDSSSEVQKYVTSSVRRLG